MLLYIILIDSNTDISSILTHISFFTYIYIILFTIFYNLKQTEGKSNGGTSGAVKLLFSGVTPRVTWIGIGGFVFFGAYEKSKQQLMKLSFFT